MDLRSVELDLPQVLVVEEVARKHLVNRDRPERAVVEVAQVLVLALRCGQAGSTSVM